jgi:hypothetical protein
MVSLSNHQSSRSNSCSWYVFVRNSRSRFHARDHENSAFPLSLLSRLSSEFFNELLVMPLNPSDSITLILPSRTVSNNGIAVFVHLCVTQMARNRFLTFLRNDRSEVRNLGCPRLPSGRLCHFERREKSFLNPYQSIRLISLRCSHQRGKGHTGYKLQSG